MNILFLYISLPHLSKSTVFTDIIREFDRQGHSVKVVTPLEGNGTPGISKEAGIDVVRFKTDQLTNNKSNIQKGIAYLKLIYQFPRAVRKYFKNEKFDLIIAHSLPPEIGLIAKILKRRYKARFYLMLCEYIWQDSVALGYFSEKSLICKYYKWMERNTIRTADYIGSPSQGNIDFVLNFYPRAKEKNIHILHYSKFPLELPASDIDVRAKYGLKDKFVAIYGGNMSIAQKIENVVNVAEATRDYQDIVFVLLGRGQEIESVKKEVERRKLSNVTFIDFLPKEDYLQLLANCDVGLVSLNEKLAIPNIPSKIVSLLNLSIPVIASIDRVTDLGKYLEDAGAGLWSYAGDTRKFKENIVKLYENPELRKQMGENALKFYMENMVSEKGYQTIMNQVKR